MVIFYNKIHKIKKGRKCEIILTLNININDYFFTYLQLNYLDKISKWKVIKIHKNMFI